MTTTPRKRAPRRDALENKEKILQAAELYFGEHGLEASLHTLVDNLGFGIGTLYRHFPTRNDLIATIYHRQAARMIEALKRATEIEDPWDTVVTAIDAMIDLMSHYPSMRAIAARMAQIDPEILTRAAGQELVTAIVTRAQDQKTIRPDATAADLAHIPTLLESVLRLPEPARGIVLARQRAIILDGIRPQAMTTPLPAQPLTGEDLHKLAHGQQ
ncbi:TetR/AcrR family transcriptional regulator, partial [Nesterenkonia ebinurensis]|uniref:TetR/AcrR family transcriptional regulator n=1 Tax=Nesterenkonia ebinurensis TaxID=2608252 RepID=UPI00123C7C30